MALDGAAAPTGQEAKTFVEQPCDLIGRERLDAGSSQLDRQRYAVETLTDPGHRRGVRAGEREVGSDRHGPVHEQFDCVTAGDHRRPGTPLRQRQRPQRPDPLTVDAEPLPAGGQDPHPPTRPQDSLRDAGHSIEEMLAVVENEQHGPGFQELDEQLECHRARSMRYAQGGHDDLGHVVGPIDGGQLAEPHTIGELGQQPRRHVHRQAGLADTADTGHRHQPTGQQQLRHGSRLLAPSHERAQLRGQIGGVDVRRTQRREVEVRVVNQDGRVELAQPRAGLDPQLLRE